MEIESTVVLHQVGSFLLSCYCSGEGSCWFFSFLWFWVTSQWCSRLTLGSVFKFRRPCEMPEIKLGSVEYKAELPSVSLLWSQRKVFYNCSSTWNAYIFAMWLQFFLLKRGINLFSFLTYYLALCLVKVDRVIEVKECLSSGSLRPMISLDIIIKSKSGYSSEVWETFDIWGRVMFTHSVYKSA